LDAYRPAVPLAKNGQLNVVCELPFVAIPPRIGPAHDILALLRFTLPADPEKSQPRPRNAAQGLSAEPIASDERTTRQRPERVVLPNCVVLPNYNEKWLNP
jgi:hypothetical protein